MKKIPSVFRRDWAKDCPAQNEFRPNCLWVTERHIPVVPTAKWDGTCMMIDEDGNPWKRRTVEPEEQEPAYFREDEGPELVETNSRHGWVPVQPNDPNDQYHLEGYHNSGGRQLPAGTYELLGPKIQGNPHGFEDHVLKRHGAYHLGYGGLGSYKSIKWALEDMPEFEGIVFYELDGPRRAKVKRTDFGMEWPTEENQ